jgi:hypothetical protein
VTSDEHRLGVYAQPTEDEDGKWHLSKGEVIVEATYAGMKYIQVCSISRKQEG